MGSRKKITFTIRDKPEPRRIKAVRDLMKKRESDAGVRRPTRTEIADLALTLAREVYELDKALVEFFHWPPWATPCKDARILYLPIINKFKKKAEESLRQHYVYYHVMAVRRKRWLRAHPRPRAWTWTEKPLKHAVPPTRKRIYRPPELDLDYPDAVSPPLPPPAGGSPKRPGWRETERLLCYYWLFDNEIAVLSAHKKENPPAEYPPGDSIRIVGSGICNVAA